MLIARGGRWARWLGSSVTGIVLVAALAGCDTSPVVVSGTVTAAPSGAGVGGVGVQLWAVEPVDLVGVTTTDGYGNWSLPASTVPDGTYRVLIGGRFWPDATSPWEEADRVVLSAGSPTVLDMSLDETGAVQGGVVDEDGTPLPDVHVVAATTAGQGIGLTRTDASGRFSLPVVQPTGLRLLLVDPTQTWPAMWVGGATPTGVSVHSGTTDVGSIVIATGQPLRSSSGTTTRVSVATDGTQGGGHSWNTAISADAGVVAFESNAPNLVAGDTNDAEDVFVHDRGAGMTARVSVATDGTEGDDSSSEPAISGNGRYVTFTSDAKNLVAGDTNGTSDVFVHDRTTGTTAPVSVATDGSHGDSHSHDPAISPDGRYVTFSSSSSNLVVGDTNGTSDVFVHDRTTGETTRVSVATDGTDGDGSSGDSDISGDGRYVTFRSSASNLVLGDTNGASDVFVHDRTTGDTTRVSVASDGTQPDRDSSDPAMSADGRVVAFHSYASNLVAGDTAGLYDVFAHDLTTGVTTRVSVGSDGTQADSTSGNPSVSADGRYVTFSSNAANLVAADTNERYDAFVHDRTTGETTRISVATDGSESDGVTYQSAISADGRVVAFYSLASNLVADDTNERHDVFVHDRSS